MNAHLMNNVQLCCAAPVPLEAAAASRSGALWNLPRGKALALPRAALPRWIRLIEGQLWLTELGQPDDHWLKPGDSLRLAAGAEVLAEGWPAASFELLEEPQA
jgi:hypothetical protein